MNILIRVAAGHYVSSCGNYRIIKEFYADGPSLFEWAVYHNGGRVAAFTTLRAAKAFIHDG